MGGRVDGESVGKSVGFNVGTSVGAWELCVVVERRKYCIKKAKNNIISVEKYTSNA